MSATIPVTRTTKSRLTEELRENSPFGTNYSDHMFVADYRDGEWRDARIVPFGPMEFSPALTALHYGQSFFEGFKAHRTADGRVALFRPMANHARLNRTAARLAMPDFPNRSFAKASSNSSAPIATGFLIAMAARSTSAPSFSAPTIR